MSGMFGGGSNNSYDDIVAKTTDENLTTENWELILNLCDKVQEEGPSGAHDVIASILKRLAHRNPNVQLYALSLAEALSKNCGIEVHREIASRAFTQGLEKLVTDRNSHDKVRKRALGLVAEWAQEFESDGQLGVMEDCYNNLKAKNYKFETPQEPPPPAVDDEIRRKEEEELQRVLEMSIKDKGGRAAYAGQWDSYGASGSGSGSSSNVASSSGGGGSGAGAGGVGGSSSSFGAYGGGSGAGYVPAPDRTTSAASNTNPYQTSTTSAAAHGSTVSVATSSTSIPSSPHDAIVTRVKALHTFEPSEPGELGFQKGDVIKVVDRGYKDWWRGQLKGKTGIFPVNYVEPMPEPTAAELAREAEKEAEVFAQAVNVEKLLNLLRGLDPHRDNLADNEEIQELYRQSMSLRPRIVKLIDKYSQKRADLVSMNETFVRARTIFERMMEESLARHTGIYEPIYRPPTVGSYAGSDPRAAQDYGSSPVPSTWGPPPTTPGYTPFPQAQTAAPGPYAGTPGPGAGYPQQQPYPQTQSQPQVGGGSPYGPQGQPGPQPYGAQPYPDVHQQPQAQLQQQPLQGQGQPQPQQQPQSQPQPQQQQQQPSGNPAGPPYVYDPTTTYADPNVQAWAQYYAQGGTDPTGSVYFISVPGVKEGPAAPNGVEVAAGAGGDHGQQQAQPQSAIQPQQQQAQQQQQGYPQPYQQQQQQQQQQPLQQGSSPSRASIYGLQQQVHPPVSAASVDSLPYPGPASERSNSLPYPGGSERSNSLPYPGPASASERSDSLPYPGPTSPPQAQAQPPSNGSTASLGTYPQQQQPQQQQLPPQQAQPGPGQLPPGAAQPYTQQVPPQPSSPTGSFTNANAGRSVNVNVHSPLGSGGSSPPPASAPDPSPATTHTTPSWVLPKMEPSTPSRFGGLQSQMSGLSIGGQGSGGA